jgi:Na+/proline symporter
VGCLAFLGRRIGQNVVTTSEFYVANRSVPLLLSVLALLATWFGSSSVVEASTKMYQGGLGEVLLDPIACGATLILTGICFAGGFWKSGCSTVAQLFRVLFGVAAERLSCAIQVPSFFLWIGAQFLAMGQLLEASLGIPEPIAIVLSALATLSIVVWGGMWAVTWANAIMIVVSIASLLLLAFATAESIGQGNAWFGVQRVVEAAPDGFLNVDVSTLPKGLSVLGVLAIGLMGNVPGQDIQQRVASARTAGTARWMCIVSGLLYLCIGLVPMYLGLAARWKFGDRLGVDSLGEHTLPINALAQSVLSEPFQIVLIVGMFSLSLAVAAGSTIGQATLLTESFLKPAFNVRSSSAGSGRWSVLLVIAGSLIVAYSGQSIMGLLELSLVLVLVSMFVPMCLALLWPTKQIRPGVGTATMTVGLAVWLLCFIAENRLGAAWAFGAWTLPSELTGLLASALTGLYLRFRIPSGSESTDNSVAAK